MEWLTFDGAVWTFERQRLSATFAICRDDALAIYRALQEKIDTLAISLKEKARLLLQLDGIWRQGMMDRHNNL